MRRWYPVGILLVGAAITAVSLRGSAALLPIGLVILILGAYSVRFAKRRPATTGAVQEPDGIPPAEFTIVLRGYARPFVDELVRRGERALAGDPATRETMRAEVTAAAFPLALRGYSVEEVDAYLADLAARLDVPPEP
jgi:DivIVA domain-containing protein